MKTATAKLATGLAALLLFGAAGTGLAQEMKGIGTEPSKSEVQQLREEVQRLREEQEGLRGRGATGQMPMGPGMMGAGGQMPMQKMMQACGQMMGQIADMTSGMVPGQQTSPSTHAPSR